MLMCIYSVISSIFFAGVVDGIIPLDEETSALLRDGLAILTCKEIKLASMRTRNADDIVEQEDMAAQGYD